MINFDEMTAMDARCNLAMAIVADSFSLGQAVNYARKAIQVADRLGFLCGVDEGAAIAPVIFQNTNLESVWEHGYRDGERKLTWMASTAGSRHDLNLDKLLCRTCNSRDALFCDTHGNI